jgi:hypothetical protein
MEIPNDAATCPVCGGSGEAANARAVAEGQRRSAAAEQVVSGEPDVLWEGRYSLADMNLVWFGTILLTALMVFLGIWYERVDPSQQVPWLHNPWILWPAALALPVLLWILVFTSKWRWGFALVVTLIFAGAAALLQFRSQVLQLSALQYWTIFLAIPLVFWVWAICVAIYRKTVVWRLTPHRLFKRYGIFVRTEDALELRVIRDMAKIQSLVERFLCGGVGRIRIWSSDPSDPVLTIRGLRDYERVFRLIDEARQKIREKRALLTD